MGKLIPIESEVKEMDKRIAELEKVIVSQAKEIAALKGQASAQPEVQTDEQIVKNQLDFLKLTQEQCIQRGRYDNVAPIAREILELITLKQTLPHQR